MRRIEYLAQWAVKHYHVGRYDLASSGVPFDLDAVPRELDQARWEGVSGAEALTRAREAVAALYGANGPQVVLAAGATGALFLAAGALSECACVAVESPVYEPLWRGPEALGIDVRFIERRPAEGYRLEAVLDHIAQDTRDCGALWVTNPHNPSGAYDSAEVMARLAEAIYPRWLVVDEVYLPFVPGARSAWGLADNICIINSLTKAHGHGSLRLGWLVAPDDFAASLHDAALYVHGRFPAMIAAAGVQPLRELPRLYAEATAHLGGRLDRVDRAISSHPRMSWTRPAGELIVGLVEIEGVDDDVAFAEAFMARHDATLAPGSFFRAPGAIRLGFGALPERFDQAFDALLDFSRDWDGR